MAGESWKIYWNEYSKDTYIYGSEIEFLNKNRVKFKNELMPPGTIIKKWYSRTNYQLMRVEPSLPMIDGEGKYEISIDIDVSNPDSYLLEIVYFDRYGADAGNKIIRGGNAEFQCPLKTYSYEVNLISAGLTEFEFHSITITELTDGE